jgi:hypothetical protein
MLARPASYGQYGPDSICHSLIRSDKTDATICVLRKFIYTYSDSSW